MQVGSRQNQPKTRTDMDGFLYHTRLGLVGWISYWCSGDATQSVVILVPLINTLGLTELVSDVLGIREEWSTEEEANMRSGHFWICKFGTVPGSMSCVEKKFELQVRKWVVRYALSTFSVVNSTVINTTNT